MEKIKTISKENKNGEGHCFAVGKQACSFLFAMLCVFAPMRGSGKRKPARSGIKDKGGNLFSEDVGAMRLHTSGGDTGTTRRRSVAQVSPELLLRALQGAADGAFVHATALGDLGNVLPVYVVGQQRLPLEGRQFLLDHPLNPPHLHRLGQARPLIALIACIFHCGNNPFHSIAPSALPTHSSL